MANETVAYQENKHNQVKSIVDHVLFKKGLPERWYQWFLEMALWHLRELQLDVWQDVKTVYLQVTSRRTVVLPGNFVDWTKVGIKTGQYFITLGVNDRLNQLQRDPDNPDFVARLFSQELPNGLNLNNYVGYYFYNYNGSMFRSIGSGFRTKGMFRVHFNGNVKELILDYDYPYDYVYLEYITDGFDPCGETVVDPYFADYLVKGMEFSWEEEKEQNRTEASIARRGRAFSIAKRNVLGRKNDLDPQTLLNISRSGFRFTPKV